MAARSVSQANSDSSISQATSESSVSQATSDSSAHTSVTPDEECEREFTDNCRLKARWINLAICFGVNLQDVFKIGMRLNVVQDDNDSDSDMDDNEKAVYITAYEKIIKFIPGLKKYLPLTGDGDLEKLHKLLEVMQKGCSTARSDTFKRVNQFTYKYLNSGTRPIQCDAGGMRKTSRGLNHPQIGRLIIPAKKVAEWDENPERSRAYFNTGHHKIMGFSMPVFLYYEYKFDPEEPDEGLFRSAFLVCVLIDILYGPQAVDTEDAKRSELYRHHCVGDMYDADTITAHMIAYSAVVARFALSSRPNWNYKEDNFDYRTFYNSILLRLSDLSDPWVEELLKWWNSRVFGNEEGKINALNMDSQEQEEWEEFVRRKAARKATKARAAENSTDPSACASTSTSDSVEVPVPTAPSACASTSDSVEVPVSATEDNEANSLGDTVPSHADGGSAGHNTPTPSPSTFAPVIDPILLHMTDPNIANNSVITQMENPVSVPPNPCVSGPECEREPSPLSNPPDEEPSTEIIGAPSSCLKKRKPVKSNKGKGKAPPKQRRKITESSQSHSAHV